jgi:hypothetical protein
MLEEDHETVSRISILELVSDKQTNSVAFSPQAKYLHEAE